MFIFVSLPLKVVCYWSAIAHMPLYFISAVDLNLSSRETGAYHKADGTQVTKDVYDEYQRAREAQRTGNKRWVVLAPPPNLHPIAIADLEPCSRGNLAEVLGETGGAVRKKDTWEDLAEKVCKPNPPPSTMQPRPPKKARPAADEDDLTPCFDQNQSYRLE